MDTVPFPSIHEQTRRTECLQVSADGGLRKAQDVYNLTDRQRGLGQHPDELPADGVTERPEEYIGRVLIHSSEYTDYVALCQADRACEPSDFCHGLLRAQSRTTWKGNRVTGAGRTLASGLREEELALDRSRG